MNICRECKHFSEHRLACGMFDGEFDIYVRCMHPAVMTLDYITGDKHRPDPQEVRGKDPECPKWERHVTRRQRFARWLLRKGWIET